MGAIHKIKEYLNYQKLNWVTNELRVLLDDLLDPPLLDVLSLILLQVKDDLGTTTQRLAIVGANGERAT